MANLKYDFAAALAKVLVYEGGYVNDPADLGGATNKGVTQAVYNRYRADKKLPRQSVRAISDKEVSDIYYQRYWLATGCDRMPAKVAIAVFDWAVNAGCARAVRTMQQVLGSGSLSFDAKMKNDLEYYIKVRGEDGFVKAYHDVRENTYRQFAQRPSQAKFLKGWLSRSQNLRSYLGV